MTELALIIRDEVATWVSKLMKTILE